MPTFQSQSPISPRPAHIECHTNNLASSCSHLTYYVSNLFTSLHVYHTYTAVKSRNNTPAFSLCWKLSSMSCVSSVTWSTVDLPRRKPACSRGSCGSMRLCINLSRILNGTQSSEMGLYDFGSCAGLLGFGRATTVARRQVSLYLRLTSCLSLSLYLSLHMS